MARPVGRGVKATERRGSGYVGPGPDHFAARRRRAYGPTGARGRRCQRRRGSRGVDALWVSRQGATALGQPDVHVLGPRRPCGLGPRGRFVTNRWNDIPASGRQRLSDEMRTLVQQPISPNGPPPSQLSRSGLEQGADHDHAGGQESRRRIHAEVRHHARRVLGVVLGRHDWLVMSNNFTVLRRERTARAANRWCDAFLRQQGHMSLYVVHVGRTRPGTDLTPLYPDSTDAQPGGSP